MNRCKWLNLNNPIYVRYHDEEWGKPKYNDKELFELLILEMFQAGLSWECILNKRDSFRLAFDNFDYNIISNYNDDKVNELLNNKNIIRNKQYKTFSNYIWSFTNNQIIKNMDDTLKVSSDLSDEISKDLKRRGMKFVGTIIIYSYLQAIGIIDDHELSCICY